MTVYAICDDDSKHESLTREQILTAITQAASGVPVLDPDAGILTKVKETNTGGYITFWVGTQAQYNALQGNTEQNCLYIITDSTNKDDFASAIEGIAGEVVRLGNTVDSVANKTTVTTVPCRTMTKLSGDDITADFGTFGTGRCEYFPALGKAYLKFTCDIAGIVAAGTDIVFKLPIGAYKRVSSPTPDPLVCCSDSKRLGNVSAWFRSDGNIVVRAVDGLEIDASGEVYVTLAGWYECKGELVS